MAVSRRSLNVGMSLQETLSACSRALYAANFRAVQLDSAHGKVTAKRRLQGQWTSATLVVRVTTSSGGSLVSAECEASAQSLIGLARNPSETLVQRFFAALQADTDFTTAGDGNLSDSVSTESRACPWCAEEIKAAAIICRFCGRDVPPFDAGAQ